MWICLLSLFVLAQSASAEVDCSTGTFQCEPPDLFTYIPSEISEFNKICPELPAFLRCLKEYQDSCKGFGFFRSQVYYDEMYGAISELCEEGTLFNTIVHEHLKCFNETFSTTSCQEKMKIVTNPHRQLEKIAENEYDYTLPIEIMCLEEFLETSCFAAEIGENCGLAAMEATLEFLRRTSDVQLFICGRREVEYLLKNLHEFTLTKEEKERLIVKLENIMISIEKEST